MPAVRRTVQVRTAPQQLVLHMIGTHVPADGRSLLTVTGRLLDVQGRVFPQDGLVTLMATGGEWAGADADPDTPGFQARVRGGQFSATLRAGLHAQTVHVRAAVGKLEAFTQAEFTTDLRPSLVTGVLDLRWGGRSTDFYRSFEDFLPPPGVSDRPAVRRLRFRCSLPGGSATPCSPGRTTAGTRSTRRSAAETSLGRDTQQSDQQYPDLRRRLGQRGAGPVAGQFVSARGARPRLRPLGRLQHAGVRVHSQQLTATTRALHALKANYELRARWQATGFYGDNVQGFQRDTIAPDGTSGYYFLSHRPLVYGSENVVIEEEELARPGTVVASVGPAARHGLRD